MVRLKLLLPVRNNPARPQEMTLAQVRLPTIEMVCDLCSRRDQFARSKLVRTFGAAAPFSMLRRRLAIGCKRMTHKEGDRCEANFPCLELALECEGGGPT